MDFLNGLAQFVGYVLLGAWAICGFAAVVMSFTKRKSSLSMPEPKPVAPTPVVVNTVLVIKCSCGKIMRGGFQPGPITGCKEFFLQCSDCNFEVCVMEFAGAVRLDAKPELGEAKK